MVYIFSRPSCLLLASISDASQRPLIIDGRSYPTDAWTNIPPPILDHYGRKLHVQPNHPLSITRKLIESCFPDFQHHNALSGVVTVDQNFNSLGFAADHPGRSRTDTYYINKDTLLRTHTSAHEVDVFRANTSNGYTIAADVYRRDAVDRTHYPAFHQMEGALTWDRNNFKSTDEFLHHLSSDLANFKPTNVEVEDANPPFHSERNPLQEKYHSPGEAELVGAHLKRSLEHMVVTIFTEADEALQNSGLEPAAEDKDPLKVRWVESFFPHTSPSWEMEVWWQGDWLEVLGCGVIEQPLLIRSEVPSRVGWAFGLGLERLAMLLFGIPDIRLFWSKDSRFLSQFDENKPIRRFQPFSKYPAAPRDVAFWLPKSGPVVAETPAATSTAPSPAGGKQTEPTLDTAPAFHENDLMEVVRSTAGDSVEDVICIDNFKHPKTGRQSLCYRVTYRSLEKTLTNEEANSLHEQIRQELVTKFGVELR
ncbi:phenylalanyl-tRNA synthetase alpha subunit, mitochondrial [Vermiconidia calcicola]|uniref:Phenylalanyl-tRNA synthetase alpha subunit, mitochondrial n=1 Tax=Vermiconidia calcicola TaxID=1690605 RepID=A0ACC3NST8_9PEZI|nr:phenylalanyl-tRNA synthetase alpha subunit, mitochondrial [Vermiconidia calcicola]